VFEQHSDVRLTLGDESSIWRYTTLGAFTWTLSTQFLNFTRVDLFRDPFEGSFGAGNLEPTADDPEVRAQIRRLTYLNVRRMMYANCWHANEHESAAMWDLYCRSGEGIAIRSNIGLLKEALHKESRAVYIGDVNYIDYAVDRVPEYNALLPMLYKRKSFEHEREVRALVLETVRKDEGESGGWVDTQPGEDPFARQLEALSIAVDLSALIREVYIAPGSPPWLSVAVSGLCTKFDLGIAPITGMSQRPIY
jgi:hypothetical protein